MLSSFHMCLSNHRIDIAHEQTGGSSTAMKIREQGGGKKVVNVLYRGACHVNPDWWIRLGTPQDPAPSAALSILLPSHN